jgi:hypothetical protein
MKNNVCNGRIGAHGGGWRRACGAAAILPALTSVLVAAAIKVCSRCGHEVADSDATCAHCGATVETEQPARAPKPIAEGNTFRPDGRLEYLDPASVDAELEAGISTGEKGDADVAYFFFRNATALLQMTDPRVDEGRTARAVALIQRCGDRGGAVRQVCRDCGGSGRSRMTITNTRGETISREVATRPCPTCDGTGFTLVRGSINDRKFQIGQAWNRYVAAQTARMMVAVGNARVPRTVEGKLGVAHAAAVKRTTADPCPECSGIGQIECRYCHGKGVVPCSNGKCKNGLVKETSRGQLSRTSITETRKCQVCDGKSFVVCTHCDGKASLLCKSCNGRGAAPECQRCGGSGWYECTRCKGTGSVNGAPCPTCKGESKVECSSCGGDGRK